MIVPRPTNNVSLSNFPDVEQISSHMGISGWTPNTQHMTSIVLNELIEHQEGVFKRILRNKLPWQVCRLFIAMSKKDKKKTKSISAICMRTLFFGSPPREN